MHGLVRDAMEPGQPGARSAPPALPRGLVAIWPVLGIGTVGWFVAFCVLLTTNDTGWFWTSLAGWVLGLIGFAISAWQRAASRSGSRSAQRDL